MYRPTTCPDGVIMFQEGVEPSTTVRTVGPSGMGATL
jgi:hypothetical protein